MGGKEDLLDYREFLEIMAEEIRSRMPDVETEIRDVSKLQGESYTGLCVKPADKIGGPVLNLHQEYDMYREGASYKKIVNSVMARLKEALEIAPPVLNSVSKDGNDGPVLMPLEEMRKQLTIEVVSAERNTELLQECPHTMIADLAVFYRVEMGESMSMLVSRKMMEDMGVTLPELHQMAVENAMRMHPAKTKSMAEMLGFSVEQEPPITVLTNETGFWGASVIVYPGIMEQVSEQVGGNFFLLPSSLHEVLVLPELPGRASVTDLDEMVRHVNSECVEPQDILSDHAYHYDAREKTLEAASDYEARMSARRPDPERSSVLKELQKIKESAAEGKERPLVSAERAGRRRAER